MLMARNRSRSNGSQPLVLTRRGRGAVPKHDITKAQLVAEPAHTAVGRQSYANVAVSVHFAAVTGEPKETISTMNVSIQGKIEMSLVKVTRTARPKCRV
eukprot:6485101-Amphidinium_carterae.1